MSEDEQLFTTFRPYCSALASKPSKAILEKLKELVIHYPNAGGLARLQEYIVFPMQLYMKTPTMPENYTLAVLDFVTTFYGKSTLTSTFVFKDLISSCLTLSIGKDKLSEDFKVSFANLITCLIKSASQDVKLFVYEEEMKLPISHIVFQLLEWTESDDSPRIVVMAALDALESLIIEPDEECYDKYVVRFAPMLPGSTTRLMKTLRRNFQSQAHKIKAKCILLWTRLVTTILNDDNVGFLSVDDESDKIPGVRAELGDPQWVGKAQDHLFQHMQMYATMTVHTHFIVRKALQTLCAGLHWHSWKSLRNSTPIMVDILTILSVDHEQAVRDRSKTTLIELLDHLARDEKDRECKVPAWVVDQAHAKIFEVSQIVANSNYAENLFHEEKVLEKHLSALHGYLLLLNQIETSSLFFYSDTYVCQLLDALLALVQLRKKSLVTEAAFLNLRDCDFLFESSSSASLRAPEKLYRHLGSLELQERMELIAGILATYCRSDIIVNHLSVKMRSSSQHERESIILLNLMILHGFHNDSLVFDLVESYLSYEPPGNHELSIPMRNREGNNEESNEDIEWSSRLLIMEGFGFMAKNLAAIGENSIRSFDRDNVGNCLVYCLKHVNVTHSHQAHVLFHALSQLSKACGYPKIEDMLASHLDYMSRQLTILLRKHFTRFNDGRQKRPTGLPTLLRVVLRLSRQQSDEKSLRDAINSLLRQLDISWMDVDISLTTEILGVIAIFVGNLQDCEKPREQKRPVSSDSSDRRGKITSLIKALKYSDELERQALQDDEEMERVSCPEEGFHQTNNDTEETTAEDNEEKSEKVPEKVKFLRETIKHCRHFISMVANPQWQLLAMEIVGKSILGIQMHQDELLPLVHQTWQPLKLLFTSNNLFVVDKAFHVLRILAQCSRDFIRKRTLDDVFPALVAHLKKLMVMVEDRNLHQTLAARQSRRLLREMTHGLWDFMALLDLSESEVDPIIDHMLQFVERAHCMDLEHSRKGEADTLAFFTPVRLMDADVLYLKTMKCN